MQWTDSDTGLSADLPGGLRAPFVILHTYMAVQGDAGQVPAQHIW